MIPRTFPSTYASNGQQQMVVYFLTSVTGLQRWADYIPVKLTQGGVENSYNNNGYIDVAVISRPTATQQAWKEYIPVYLDDAATDAWRVNAVGYIPYGYALFNGASMMMDLTNGGSLDPRVTFSRASNATLVNSAGAVAYAPHNLLTFSESFDNSVWVKFSGSVTANTSVAPDGTTTADTFVANGVSGLHRVQQTASAVASGGRSFSVYAKAGTNNFIQLLVDSDTAPWANFNLASGTIGSQGTNQTATIESVGNGWFRCTLFSNSANATSVNIAVITDGASVRAETNSLATTVLLWGAQLNVGALQPYNCTTVENALGFTQEFNNAAWTKTNSTITANATAAPDGSVTADKLVEDTANATHFTRQNFTATVGTPFTSSVYLKAAERTSAVLIHFDGSVFYGVSVNLSNGTISAPPVDLGLTDATASALATVAANGYWRISITRTQVSTTTCQLRVALQSGSNGVYTGDGTSGILIWGAQISDSASLDPYVYNPAAAFTSTAYYGPRFDYDPATLAPRGLLIEEQRTNSIRNNTMVGAVAGTPGTLPTNWQRFTSGTAATAVVGVGTESGIPYVDVRFTGGNGEAISFFLDGTTGHAASNGQTWTGSAYYRLIAGSFANISACNQAVYEATSVGTALAATSTLLTGVTTAGLATQRIAVTRTNNNASTAEQQLALNFSGSGGTFDITLRIGLPQLEQGAFATSVIPTTTAAATRAADVATMVGDNFSNWYNQTEGTLLFDGVVSQGLAAFPWAWNITDGTTNNSIGVYEFTNGVYSTITTSGVNQTPDAFVLVAQTAGSAMRHAFAFKTSDSRAALNGTLSNAQTTAIMPTVSQLSVGRRVTGNTMTGHIRRIAYFNRRLQDTQLQALTV